MRIAAASLAPRVPARNGFACFASLFAGWAAFGDGAVGGASSVANVPIRDVRVLLASNASRIRITAAAPFEIRTDRSPIPTTLQPEEPLIIERGSSGVLQWGESRSAREELRTTAAPNSILNVSLDRDGAWTEPVAYPGGIRLRPDKEGGIEVVNEVDLEQYVGCVVAGEVWPTFQIEALRGQAIVTRTFVLYHMTRRPDAAVDVSATQGSQVYRGLRDDAIGRKSREAADYTRGLVLTYDDRGTQRLFCAYFSAACGGSSQPAKGLGAEGDVEPLKGGVRCDYCKIAPGDAYRWGPVSVALDDLQARLTDRYPDMEALGRIASITPVERAVSGRSISLRITGAAGRSEDIIAERFRQAVGPGVMKSTDCRIRVLGDEIVFDQGKGFGHGLGLCQWGMEGLARDGKQAAEILRFYYPGSTLTRVY